MGVIDHPAGIGHADVIGEYPVGPFTGDVPVGPYWQAGPGHDGGFIGDIEMGPGSTGGFTAGPGDNGGIVGPGDIGGVFGPGDTGGFTGDANSPGAGDFPFPVAAGVTHNPGVSCGIMDSPRL